MPGVMFHSRNMAGNTGKDLQNPNRNRENICVFLSMVAQNPSLPDLDPRTYSGPTRTVINVGRC